MTPDQAPQGTISTLLELRFPLHAGLPCRLPYCLIRVSGNERISFLNRILTQNVPTEAPNPVFVWTALCNPQGRVLAAFRVRTDRESVSLVVESELAEALLQTLRRYMLRSRVEITLELESLIGMAGPAVSGRDGEHAPALILLGQDPVDGSMPRCIFMNPQPALPGRIEPGFEPGWSARDFWQGIPHIYAISSGRFIPHALNLMGLDAVSLRKGCYPGQEIIARTTYRGHAKRTLTLLETQTPLPAGTTLLEPAQETESGWILDSCTSATGEAWIQAVMEERVLDSAVHGDRAFALASSAGVTQDYRMIRTFKAA